MLAAIVLIDIGILALLLALNSGMVTLRRTAQLSTASVVADKQIEQYRATTYTSIYLDTTSLGSTTLSVSSPSLPTLVSTGPFALAATSFAGGDHLILDISVPDDPNNCPAVRVSYDSTGQPSKLTLATSVPEGVLRLLLLTPAFPVGLRWWKRRRP